MLKQIEIWNTLNENTDKRIKVISDEYYHETVAVTTSTFLNEMKEVVLSCQEKIRQKRKALITETTMAIREEWEKIRLSLIDTVHHWCKNSQED